MAMVRVLGGYLEVESQASGSPPTSPGYPAHPIHYPWLGDPGFSAPPGWGPGMGNRPTHPIHYPWLGDPGFSAPPGWGPGGGGWTGDPGFSAPPGWGLHPAHPIVLPPVLPGGPPVTIWPKPGPLPHPEHPIVLPPPPTEGLEPGGGKPPPSDGGWGYHPVYGWGYFPGPQEPGPKGATTAKK